MPSGLTANYVESLYRGTTAVDLDAATNLIGACLWGDASSATAFPAEAELSTVATATYTAALAAWGTTGSGAVNVLTGAGAAHLEELAPVARTTGTAAAYVFDSANTTITTPTAHVQDKDIVLFDLATAGTLAGTDVPIAYFELATKVQPNGQDVIITWHANGLFQFGATTP